MGSWLVYGLGTENQNLPGFVVLCPGLPVMGSQLWSSAYLPGVYQGVHVRNREEEDPSKLIHYVKGSREPVEQRRQLDLLGKLNRYEMERDGSDPELEAGIENMEMAFRMQTEALEAFDIRKESAATRERYGEGFFANGCLIARRLLERGVRTVQVYFGNRNPWDSHADIFDHRKLAWLSGPPDGFADSGSQVQRTAGRDHRDDRRGIRPHSLKRRRRQPRVRPRTQPSGIHDSDGGWRLQEWHRRTVPPTIWVGKRLRIPYIFTICTRPFCTSSDWITHASLFDTAAAMSG